MNLTDSTEYKLSGKHYIKKVFINLSRIACFYLLVLVHMQINVVHSGLSSRSALHDSQSAFLQRIQKVLPVLLLFDIVLCLIQVTVIFFLIFKNRKPKIISKLLHDHYHNIILSFWFMHKIDTLFEHMQSYRTSNNKTSKKMVNINSSKKYITRLACHGII